MNKNRNGITDSHQQNKIERVQGALHKKPRIEIGEVARFRWHTDDINAVFFSLDGTKFLTVADNSVAVWYTELPKGPDEYLLDDEIVFSASFSPDGNKVIIATDSGTARLWDVENNLIIRMFEGHTDVCRSARFSPDGKRIVTASQDKTIRIWDAATGECIRIIEGHTDCVCFASYSPDGKRIVSASWDCIASVWDAETGECIHLLDRHLWYLNSAVSSNDGSKIVTASQDGTTCVWNAETGECLATLSSYACCYAEFTSDGKRILTVSGAKGLKFWDANTYECIDSLCSIDTESNPSFRFASFAPDGQTLVSVTDSLNIYIWFVRDL